MIDAGVLRLKYVFGRNGRVIAIGLAIIAVLAVAGAGWAAANPPTETVSEPTQVQTISSEAELVATVTGETALWEQGTRLEGAPLFPREAAPDPKIRVETTVPAGQSVEVAHDVTVVYRAARDGQTVWQSTRPVLRDDQTVTDGRATASAPIDIDAIQARTSRLNDELTGISRVDVILRLNVSYATDRYTGHVTETTSLHIASSGYWLGGSIGFEETRSTPVTREVTRPRDLGAIGGMALFALLAGIGAVGAWKYRDIADPAAIKHQLDLTRCREWISAGRIRQPISGQDVSMNSLEDLVDVAIDSKRRVVHDDERDLYAVFDGNRLYYFDPLFDREEIDREGPEATAELEQSIRSDGAGDDEPSDGTARFSTPERDAWDRLLADDEGDDSYEHD